jgi:hypothetical protein
MGKVKADQIYCFFDETKTMVSYNFIGTPKGNAH